MNKRIFIEKNPQFDYQSKSTTDELQLISKGITAKVFIVYDIFGLNEIEFSQTKHTVFTDPVMDKIHLKIPDFSEYDNVIAVEYLPGQFDQKANSAEQAIQLLTQNNAAKIRTGTVYAFKNITENKIDEVKKFLINAVEAREKNLDLLQYPDTPQPEAVKTMEGFIDFNSEQLTAMHAEWSFAFGLDDLEFIQKYFQKENRNPTETELKVLDTYWSDHCRHTTFLTELTDIQFKGDFKEVLEQLFQKYLSLRKEFNREHKPISLMDLGTIAAKYFHAKGQLNDLVISDEINACTIQVDIDVEGKKEPWYLLFKNETHNHPTEIEPFGGASTCVGGAIRDPLSGRAFVYQAMRVTGAANPLEPIENTLPGKLPQRKITREAANGYSSYGNQIGLATSQVSEIYHEGYKAKRMEVGMVVGAVPVDYVRREKPEKGDLVIVLGGKTGRDGIGGATGSSKTHTQDSIDKMSAEVQKGDAVQERKIQRLFRQKKATQLIKKSNDFGAGGVSVAIGEIADGLQIDLNKLPVKYAGLNGTELAISESQERMAVVVEAKDADEFIRLAAKEGILAVVVAEVTDTNRLRIQWNGKNIVDLDRTFLDTAGVIKQISPTVQLKNRPQSTHQKLTQETLIKTLQSLNVASQKGLIEKFDSTVGQTTALMPLGGKNQLTPALASVHTFPILHGKTSTVSLATWGFNAAFSEQNPLLGGAYAVVESVAKMVASGGDYSKIRLSFQEYFERLTTSEKWGKPLASILGALDAQLNFEIAAIGGKDSMSGTFHNLNVPPTLISFAVAPGKLKNVISPEFKSSGNKLYLYQHQPDKMGMPDYDALKNFYQKITQGIQNGKIVSAQTLGEGGIATALAKMSFGNDFGCEIQTAIHPFELHLGSIILEATESFDDFEFLGKTISDKKLIINQQSFDLEELKSAWCETFEELFPTKYPSTKNGKPKEFGSLSFVSNSTKTAKPKVAIPVFSGTNCEYESKIVFEREDAVVDSFLFNGLNQQKLNESIEKLAKSISESQIFMLPGGFSSGDEPDGSAKYIVSVLKNPKIKDAVHGLLERDGLILGICNGFQALVKSGLVTYGEIRDLDEASPTLAHNVIGRHISQMVNVKVSENNQSPWLQGMQGEIFRIPVSHGEGRFFANDTVLEKLISNGQIATQYVDLEGNISTQMPFNPNGSVWGIEGITDPSGKIYGRMGHPERYSEGLLKNIPDATFMNIFKNGVAYFRGS